MVMSSIRIPSNRVSENQSHEQTHEQLSLSCNTLPCSNRVRVRVMNACNQDQKHLVP